jgi:hypothetical protein
MDFLLNILILFLFIPSCFCAINNTYVLSSTTNSEINSLLDSNGLTLTNSSSVTRLSSSTSNFVSSTRTLLSATNIKSVVFAWDTGDCSYPSALAVTYSNIYISSPICFTQVSSLNNLLQLTATSQQLGQAATVFMNQYSLHYFSMILSDSNDFYSNLAEQFTSYLTQKSFFFERSITVPSFSATSISSLKTRGKSIHIGLTSELTIKCK